MSQRSDQGQRDKDPRDEKDESRERDGDSVVFEKLGVEERLLTRRELCLSKCSGQLPAKFTDGRQREKNQRSEKVREL